MSFKRYRDFVIVLFALAIAGVFSMRVKTLAQRIIDDVVLEPRKAPHQLVIEHGPSRDDAGMPKSPVFDDSGKVGRG